ncbi:MAG: hypothetical protein LBU60_02135, partial [Clostridiales bacterium]|nr:hypothetical protein [Clostridiales bacterium]
EDSEIEVIEIKPEKCRIQEKPTGGFIVNTTVGLAKIYDKNWSVVLNNQGNDYLPKFVQIISNTANSLVVEIQES